MGLDRCGGYHSSWGFLVCGILGSMFEDLNYEDVPLVFVIDRWICILSVLYHEKGKAEPSNKVSIPTSSTELSDDVFVNGSVNSHDPGKSVGHESDDFAMLEMTSSVISTHQTEPFSSRVHWFGWFCKQFYYFL